FAIPDDPLSCYVTMRDGCRLAVDVFVPQPLEADGSILGNGAPARYPTIVIFTPYFRRFRLREPGAEPSPNTAKYSDAFVPKG
ncbi:hypothetical protein ABTF01_21295, partial [Acinetobacter baumannii]